MTTKRVKLIAAALALVLVVVLAFLVFSTPQSGVHVYSSDKRIAIVDARYFDQTNFWYTFPLSRIEKLQLRAQYLLSKTGIHSTPWKWVIQNVFQDNGPALVVNARLRSDESVVLHIAANGGAAISPTTSFMMSSVHPVMAPSAMLFVFKGPFTNGDYHLSYFTKTNDLAIIRVKQ